MKISEEYRSAQTKMFGDISGRKDYVNVADSGIYGLNQQYAAFFSAECLKNKTEACALNRSIFT